MRLITARATSKIDHCPEDTQGSSLNRVGAYESSMGSAINSCIPCPERRGSKPPLSRRDVIDRVDALISGYLSEGSIDKQEAEDLAKSLKEYSKLAFRTRFR